MPGFDHTGPSGQGARTGRNMGKCRPANRDSNEVLTSDRPRHGRLRNATDRNNQGGFHRRGQRQQGGL